MGNSYLDVCSRHMDEREADAAELCHCGGDPEWLIFEEDKTVHVRCSSCGICGPWEYRCWFIGASSRAVKLWNGMQQAIRKGQE